MIGLRRGTVKLVKYNPRWKDLFEQEKTILQEALGELAIDIQHIGSTSIPGIKAKPIIDIEIGVKNLDLLNVERIAKVLETVKYEWRRQNSNPENYIFVKGTEENRTHYLHLVEHEGRVWNNDLWFRDYLRGNPEVAKEYEELKTKLAKAYREDREKYTKGKGNFFRSILQNVKSKK